MAKNNSQDFYVKIYLDEFDASDYLVEQYDYEVAYKFLKAKANLYFNNEDTCPDNPIAIGFWVSGVKRRTIADREHRQYISQVRSNIRKKDKDDNCNNCNQKEQLITIDNNCNQKEQLITIDAINRVNRETELTELNNSPPHAREAETSQSPLNNKLPPQSFQQGKGDIDGDRGGAKRTTLEEVLEYAKIIGCPEWLARKFFIYYRDGWVTNGVKPRPFKWQEKLMEWVSNESKFWVTRTNNSGKKTNLNVNDEYADL